MEIKIQNIIEANEEKVTVAGMSMKGGRRDQFFLCLLQYFSDSQRWFLKSLLLVKDEKAPLGKDQPGDDSIAAWALKYAPKKLVVDIPLSFPPCQSCHLKCPGTHFCPVPEVKGVAQKIKALLAQGQDQTLSRTFKRKLKKGYLPYWHRPIDFLIWQSYGDILLDVFATPYELFGHTSLSTLARFSYLKRHFPEAMELVESYIPLILLELLGAEIVERKHLDALSYLEGGHEARLDIVKRIAEKLGIFIYHHDFILLSQNVRAFDSFLLALVGKHLLLGQVRSLASWAKRPEDCFAIPHFHLHQI